MVDLGHIGKVPDVLILGSIEREYLVPLLPALGRSFSFNSYLLYSLRFPGVNLGYCVGNMGCHSPRLQRVIHTAHMPKIALTCPGHNNHVLAFPQPVFYFGYSCRVDEKDKPYIVELIRDATFAVGALLGKDDTA